ncbi:MAG: septal ring lytic transglycosylase RlpA family protein [Rhodothermales bacterium]
MHDAPHRDHESLPTRRKRVPLARAFRGLRRRITLYRTVAATTAVALVALAAFTVVQANEQPEPVPLGTGKAGVEGVTNAPRGLDATAPEAPARSAEAAPEAAPAKPLGDGDASYYGEELAGNPTASGERFDPTKLTAAHRTLPLGSRVRVTNTRTGDAVVVRINDRGPFHGQRVIDLSKAAAKQIGMLKRGTARVKLELLPRNV